MEGALSAVVTEQRHPVFAERSQARCPRSRKDQRHTDSKQGIFRDQTAKTIPQAPGLRDGCRLEHTLRCC
jgi:hypothetical protein